MVTSHKTPKLKKVKIHRVHRKKFVPDPFVLVLVSCVILLVAMIAALVVTSYKQVDTIGKYEILELIDNQACRYLDGQPEVNGSFDLDVDAPKDKPKLSYTCTNGQKVTAREIQGKTIGDYSMGASVIYFTTRDEANSYAEQKLNPLRFWGVDQAGQEAGIPQSSLFTFVVTEPPMYFDAYTVKANAVLRVSLPCPSPDDPDTAGDCQAYAESMLVREMKGVNIL